MRAFISINLTDELHQAIDQIQLRLNRDARGIRWTRAENCHLTLKFLGDVSEEVAQSLIKELEPVGSSFDPFHLELGSIGQFPPHGPLSVLWVGTVHGEAPLRALEQAIHQRLVNAAVPFDRKPFSPHLTIGRARKGDRPFLANAKEYENMHLGSLQVREFCLMESLLQPSGPVYTVRARFPLGKFPMA